MIQDARRRQRRRRAGVTIALAVLAVAAGLVALGGGRGGSHRAGAGHRAPRAGAPVRPGEPRLRDIRLVPSLQGGSAGWGFAFGGGEGAGSMPTPHTPIFGEFFGYTPQRGWDTVALTTPGVAAIAADGVMVRTRDIGLQYGFRVARIRTPAPPQRGGAQPNAPPGAPFAPRTRPALIALDAHGHRIARQMPRLGHLPTAYWQRPSPMPPGPCRITATLPGLSPQWGHVATQIRAFNDLVGRAFESCADTEFYLHNWPLETAILLDAAHPGKSPAPIPNMTPVPGVPDTFSAPGASPSRDITATRLPNAWLVVQGGSGAAQRVTVLRHLHATLSLN